MGGQRNRLTRNCESVQCTSRSASHMAVHRRPAVGTVMQIGRSACNRGPQILVSSREWSSRVSLEVSHLGGSGLPSRHGGIGQCQRSRAEEVPWDDVIRFQLARELVLTESQNDQEFAFSSLCCVARTFRGSAG